MQPPLRPAGALKAAPSLLLAAFALSACAGAGRSYPCNPDGGVCGGNPFADGGTTTVSDYVSPAVTIFHDGHHNSDIDVVSFPGGANSALYAVFRSAPTFTVSATTTLTVVVSTDQGKTWSQTAQLSLSDLDLREPKLSVFQGALRVTATAWEPNDVIDHHTTVVIASSSDGTNFTKLADAGLLSGSEVWRPRVIADALWISAWKADELFPNDIPGGLSLYASKDGLTFSAPIVVPVTGGAHQGELIVRSDSSLWMAVPSRAESSAGAQQIICHTPLPPPLAFNCWAQPGAPILSPVLFEFDGVLFVSGGHDLGDGRRRTALWQVIEQDQSLSLIADLPQSMGETGAPGVVGLDSTHALLTYHSTSTRDPNVQALGHEPTTVEAESAGYAVDTLAVTIDFSQVPAGR